MTVQLDDLDRLAAGAFEGFVVRKDLPVNNIQGLIALAKSKPAPPAASAWVMK